MYLYIYIWIYDLYMLGSFSWTPSHFFQWKRDPGRPSWRDVCSEAEGPIIKMSNYASWRDIIRWSVKGGLDHLSGGKKGLQPDIKVENYIIQWNEGKVSEIFFWGDTFSLKTKRKHGWKEGSWKMTFSFWESLCWGASCLHQGVYVV